MDNATPPPPPPLPPNAPLPPAAVAAPAPTPGKAWYKRWWIWAIIIGVPSLLAAFLFGIIAFVFTLMKSSGAYTDAMAALRENPAAVVALGDPIEAGMFVTGNVSVSGSSGNATLTVPVSGPHAGGTLHVEAVKRAGQWHFESLVLTVDPGGEQIDLLAGERPPPGPEAQP